MNKNEITLETHITLREWVKRLEVQGINVTYDWQRKQVIKYNIKRYFFLNQKNPIYYRISELEEKLLPYLLAKEARLQSIKH